MTDAELDALIADAEYEHERGRTAGGDVTAAALCGRLAAALRELRKSCEMREAEIGSLALHIETLQAECARREDANSDLLKRNVDLRDECERLRKELDGRKQYDDKNQLAQRVLRAEAALAAAQALLSECAEHWASQRNVPPDSLAGRVRAAIAARKE